MTDDDGPLPVRHDQAGRLPVAQPPQRLAPGAHPLLAVRAGVRHAAGHPDVLPRRSAVLPGPDLQLGPRPRRRASGWSAASTSTRPSPSGRSATGATSCCAAATATPMETDDELAPGSTPSQTVGPFFAHRAALRADEPARRARTDPGAIRDRGHGPRRRGRRRSATRWSRSGRPNRTGATPPRGPARSALEDGFPASAAARPTPMGASRSSPSSPGRCPARTAAAGAAHRRLGLRPRPARPAGDADLLPRRGRGQRGRPGAARSIADAAARPTLVAAARTDGVLRFDIRLQGEGETVFFDV